MAGGTDDLDTLIALMGKLPGFGPRSARRAVLHLIKKRSLVLIPLAETMQRVGATARECLNCGNIGTTDICDICTSDKRAIGQICVVEDVADLWAMERSGVFKGRYHVLGGTLALAKIGPFDQRVVEIIRNPDGIVDGCVLEITATIDGQTTAHYIADQLPGISVTSLAQGVPVGGELDYLDDGTITAALNARKAI